MMSTQRHAGLIVRAAAVIGGQLTHRNGI